MSRTTTADDGCGSAPSEGSYSGLPNKRVKAANGIDHVYRDTRPTGGCGLYSYLLAGVIPQARVKNCPNAAHRFLLQHHADVDAFLGGPQ